MKSQSNLNPHSTRYATNAELLASVIGERTPQVAYQLLDDAEGSLRKVLTTDARRYRNRKGIGPRTMQRLAAVAEISRRSQSEEAGSRIEVRCPQDAAAVYGPLMRDLKREVFRVVMLNTANVIQGDYVVSEGGLAASIVEPRLVFKPAILDDAAAIIAVHNHPSGNPEPSAEDVRITRKLAEAGKVMGIPLHDHLVIAGDDYTSLAERGVLN